MPWDRGGYYELEDDMQVSERLLRLIRSEIADALKAERERLYTCIQEARSSLEKGRDPLVILEDLANDVVATVR